MSDVAGSGTTPGAADADRAPFRDRQPWRKYAVLANLAMQRTLAYRARYVVGALTGLVQIGVLFYLWRAFYADAGRVAGYGWEEMRSYLFLTFVLNLLVTFQTEGQMSAGIRDGSIATDLTKPIDYQRARLAEAAGAALMEGAVFGAGASLVAAASFRIAPPAGGLAGLPLLVAALVAAFLLKFLLAYLTGILCFWTTNVVGVITVRNTIALFFSGGLIPLAFLPGWLERLALFLPFQGTIHTPVAIYLGRATGGAAALAVAVQLAWIVALWWGARLLFRAGIRRVTIDGG